MVGDWLTRKLLEDRELAKQREAEKRAARSYSRADFDPFKVTRWRIIAGGDPGYLAKTPMRMGKVGWWLACRACGQKFESKGMAYCETCLALPAEERRQMKPGDRQCEAPGCANVISGTARADARYCSRACRKRANRKAALDAKCDKIDRTIPDTAPPQNVTLNAQKDQQNQGPKSGSQETEGFSKLRSDAVLSNWRPHVTPQIDIPDIPDFLRRT